MRRWVVGSGAGVVSWVLEVIGVDSGGAVTSGAGGTGKGVLSTVVVVVVSATTLGDCVTVTLELALFGMMLTLVLRPVAEPLPALPTELDVYAAPLLSTLAGPGMMAGLDGDVTFCAFTGAGAVPTA